jgi:D-alanyl-D-alanine carboxypeptidase (penicillin-binding protein 5/6)
MNLLTKKNYFLFFVMVVFVFVSTTALSLGKIVDDSNKNFSLSYLFQKSFPDNPVLKDGGSFPVISAEGALAVDLASGVTLYEKNADAALLPASTTKIITALVALDTYSLEQILTVPPGVNVDGQKMRLYTGEQMTVEDLLYGLLVYSANDAAMTLAMDYPGGFKAFITAMNQKAETLYMANSHFENPVGLDGANQTTTAKDLLRASEVAMRNPEFVKIVGTKSILLTDISGKSRYNLENVNELLGNVPGVSGIKTGWTENARENLVTYIERDGHRVIIVLLGSQDRFGETKQLIDWIFESYEWQEVKVSTLLDSNRQ